MKNQNQNPEKDIFFMSLSKLVDNPKKIAMYLFLAFLLVVALVLFSGCQNEPKYFCAAGHEGFKLQSLSKLHNSDDTSIIASQKINGFQLGTYSRLGGLQLKQSVEFVYPTFFFQQNGWRFACLAWRNGINDKWTIQKKDGTIIVMETPDLRLPREIWEELDTLRFVY